LGKTPQKGRKVSRLINLSICVKTFIEQRLSFTIKLLSQKFVGGLLLYYSPSQIIRFSHQDFSSLLNSFEEDKQGLGITKRQKKRAAAQEIQGFKPQRHEGLKVVSYLLTSKPSCLCVFVVYGVGCRR
jgi:hypothetical protein